MRRLVLALLIATAPIQAQDVTLEYRVKAAFLYNFTKFVDWPVGSQTGPLTICVAGRNPLGSVLDDLVKNETIDGRPVVTRIILEPESGCHVMFVPEGAATDAYLRATRMSPTLTVGESPTFLRNGGIVNFLLEGGKVRFEINSAAADRAQLRISSRLRQLARVPSLSGENQ